MENLSRREFMKLVAAAGAAMGPLGAMTPGHLARAANGQQQTQFNIERRELGRTGMAVSVLGFGGAEIGYRETDQASVQKLLNSALDAGLNVIDTAASYWGSEEAIGQAVGHRRQEYFLFTKDGHVVNGDIAWYQGWSERDITRSIERSLRRLRTDHLEVIHLHSCDLPTLMRGEAIETLHRAKQAGKTRYIGYSGDNGVWPGPPVTPPPGCAPEPHRYSPAKGIR